MPPRNRWFCILLSVVFFHFSHCGDKEQSGYKIAVIPKGLTHEFWKSIHAGAMQAKKELNANGVAIEIDWQGPNKESDRDQQIKIVENQMGMGTDAIVLAPLDANAMVRPVMEAYRNKIPVVIIGSGLDIEPNK